MKSFTCNRSSNSQSSIVMIGDLEIILFPVLKKIMKIINYQYPNVNAFIRNYYKNNRISGVRKLIFLNV